ncbi:MAG: hypothetical protein ACNA8W_18000 [Bradymonadaceae bacterium]
MTEKDPVRCLITGVLNTPRSVQDICRAAHLKENETLAALLTLHELGLLNREKSTVWTRVRTQRVEHIQILHSRLTRENHFEILGLHWSAFDEQVEETYVASRILPANPGARPRPWPGPARSGRPALDPEPVLLIALPGPVRPA